MSKEKKQLNSREASIVLDMCPEDVVTLARKGRLDGWKHGKCWKFRRKDLLEYKERREQAAAEANGNGKLAVGA